MNYYPLARKSPGTSDRSRRTVGRILREANDLFTTQGFSKTTLDQIARRADVGPSTLARYYPSKRELAVALIQLHAQDDPELSSAVGDRSVHDHLTALAHFARARPELSAPYLSHLADPTAGHDDDPQLTQMAQHLEPAADSTLAPLETAEALVLHTIRGALVDLSVPAQDVATRTLALIHL